MEEEVKKKEKKNMAYLAIGVLTLIISTAGATFAYFTATAANNGTITGNMATIEFTLDVAKMTTVDDDLNRGLIPMSNSMVESAVANQSVGTKGICMDDNGNAVCQIYKITVANTGTASMLLDGYVTLTGGSGTATDQTGTNNATTMRWSQAFCSETSGTISGCTTAGITTTTATKSDNGVATGITSGNNWAVIQNTGTADDSGFNRTQIKTTGVTTKAMIAGSEYDVINTNYIRISDHKTSATYTQSADVTSALVYNEFLNAQDSTTNPTGGSSSTYTDSQVYYIVVWLTETGTDQTVAEANRNNFFRGTVKFISAQGSEVTATFSGYTSVTPDTMTTT